MSSKSVNKVILVGDLGKDPEVKYTTSGITVARFSLATSERFKDQSGEFQERTEWHSIVAWQKLAEIVGEFLSKGSKVYVEGKLQTSDWKDRLTGEKKYPDGGCGKRIGPFGLARESKWSPAAS